MRALVAHVPQLKHKGSAQFLLHIEVPVLCIRCLHVARDTHDVKGRLRSTGSKNGYTHTEWDGRGWRNRIPTGVSNRILRKRYVVVERNGVEVGTITRANDGLALGQQGNGWRPGQPDTRSEVPLGR